MSEGEGGEGFYIAQSGRSPDLLVIWGGIVSVVYCPAGLDDNGTTYILGRGSHERGRAAQRRRVQIKHAEYESPFPAGKCSGPG